MTTESHTISPKKFVCPRCGVGMNLKSNLISHLQNKTSCPPNVSDISVVDAISMFKKKDTKLKQEKCPQCEKVVTKQNMKRHMEVCNRKAKQQCSSSSVEKDEMKAFILQAIEDAVKKYVGSAPTQNIINNNILNITINSFGNEDMSHITTDLLTYCIMNPTKGITRLIDNIHYNEVMPCNRNIRYKSTKNNTFEVFTDNQWVECDASNTLDELIRKGYRVMNSHYLANHFNEDDDDDPVRRRALERFRFLADKTSIEYCAVKRDLRLLIKNKTLYVVAPPQEGIVSDALEAPAQ